MDINRQTEQATEHWRTLIRAGCLALTSGYPGGITVSRHCSEATSDAELELMAALAVRIAEEYGLEGEVSGQGYSLLLHVAHPAMETAPGSEKAVVEVAPRPHHRMPLLARLLEYRPAAERAS